MRDDDDGAAGISRDGNQVIEFCARFVRGVQRTPVADIRAERIKNEKTCVEFFDCFFDSVITEGQVLFVFADKDQSFTVAVGSDEPGHDGIVRVVFGRLINDRHRLVRVAFIRKRKRFSLR